MRTSLRASLCILLAATALGQSTGASEREQESSDAVPGNGLIVYTDGGSLYTMRRDGSGGGRVPLPGSVRRPWNPAWSPDGTKIAFNSYSSNALGMNSSEDIHVYDTKTGNTRTIVAGTGEDFSPSWSPDGTRLVYASNQTGNSELHIVNLGSGVQRQLTDSSLPDSGPAWGPGGRNVAFTRCRAHFRCRIALFNLRKGTVRFLTPRRRPLEDTGPTWSPRGGWLAFTRYKDMQRRGWIELVKMRSDGTGVKRLTFSPEGSIPQSPSWSPNGRRIVYQMSHEYDFGKFDDYLRMVRPNGSDDRRLTPRGEPDEYEPDWQPRPR